MKKLIFAALLFGLYFINMGREMKDDKINNLYPLTTYVVDVDINSDIVTVVDFNGFQWQFDGVEDWTINDICSMIMDNNGTPYIFDDKIVKTKNDGYIKSE